MDDIKKVIEEAPEECPITKLSRCNSYIINGNAVYLPYPAYDAYTLPIYDAETGEFSRIKYDMDDDNREEHEHLCHIEDLQDRKDFDEIKKFYGIA